MMILVKTARKARARRSACFTRRSLPRPAAAPRWIRNPGELSATSSSIRTAPGAFIGQPERATAPPVPAWKRLLDVTCILASLPVTLPLLAATAVWIKLVSHGPVLFRQRRIGRHGKCFTLYKFRSMMMDADTSRHQNHFRYLVYSNQPMVKLDLPCDPRVLPGGRLIRAAGLDELPQLLNVLRGEMSLVGPRPCLVEEFHFFNAAQRKRLEALPGLTGLWQVHGKGVSTFSEMNAMDAIYIERLSLAMDLRIILSTPLALIHQMRQACRQHRATDRETGSATSRGGLVSGYSDHRSR